MDRSSSQDLVDEERELEERYFCYTKRAESAAEDFKEYRHQALAALTGLNEFRVQHGLSPTGTPKILQLKLMKTPRAPAPAAERGPPVPASSDWQAFAESFAKSGSAAGASSSLADLGVRVEGVAPKVPPLQRPPTRLGMATVPAKAKANVAAKAGGALPPRPCAFVQQCGYQCYKNPEGEYDAKLFGGCCCGCCADRHLAWTDAEQQGEDGETAMWNMQKHGREHCRKEHNNLWMRPNGEQIVQTALAFWESRDT